MHPSTRSIRPFAALLTMLGCGSPSVPNDGGLALDGEVADASSDAAGLCGGDIALSEGMVRTASGVVRGVRVGEVWSYRGVPFAESPQPFTPPQPRACWDGVFEANAWPSACVQMRFDGMPGSVPTGTPTGENDCLALNVWAPASAAAPRPVLVFIHGGGNQQGSTSEEQGGTPLYEGDLLAARQDVIVVTLQYRLGPFGYFAHPALADAAGHAGNYGLSDQIAGLRWVADNIAAFGGDPSRVMIFGESGGALDVCALLASPLTAGLFHAAIMESGGCLATSRADAEAQAIAVATELGCPEGSDRACLEGITEEAWLAIIEPPLTGGRVGLAWGPTVDGHVLLDVPEAVITRGEHQHVPFIIGTNADEMAASVARTVTPDDVRRAFAVFGEYADELLALYPPGTTDAEARAAYVGATTDGQFTCTARRIAAAAAASQDEPVFRYFFDHVPDTVAGRLLGAIHGLELLYVFSTYERTDYGPRANDDDRAVASLFGERWSALVRQGSPEGTPVWPSYDGTEPSLVIAGTPRVETEIRRAECEVWEAIRAAP